MAILPKSVSKLIESFERLPGIGPKTAARLTFYLLHVPQDYLDTFGSSVQNLKRNTVYCAICWNIGEQNPCMICTAVPSRDTSVICVVEQPIDILSIEKTGKHKGVYHVLHGAIDPLNNIGPDELRINELLQRVKGNHVTEIILATNPTMEGEATAMYIKREISNFKFQISNFQLKITRLAHGLPVGGDLEYADEVTLSRALEGRREF